MSRIIDDLNALAERLGKDGYPTAVIERAATRMAQLETYVVETHRELYPDTVPNGEPITERLRKTLRMGLEIHDEYMTQIGKCVSQDYARLNEFPIECAKLGVKLDAD